MKRVSEIVFMWIIYLSYNYLIGSCLVPIINLYLSKVIYATADEAVAYMFCRCFFLFFCFLRVRLLFMQPPSGRRRMRICFADVFLFFFPSVKNVRQPFSGTAERIFMKLLPNDTGVNVVWNVVPPLGESRAAAWRMANVDDLRNLRYDSFAITRERHARQLRYKIVSLRTDLI